MSAKKKLTLTLFFSLYFVTQGWASEPLHYTPSEESLANQLGWVTSSENNCGGFFIEEPFTYPKSDQNSHLVEVIGKYGLASQRNTSILEGNVTISRFGQQLKANKVMLNRDPETNKLDNIDLIGNVHFREPNTLIIAKSGHYELKNNGKTLNNLVYRTAISKNRQVIGPKVAKAEIVKARKLNNMTAWGTADQFVQNRPLIYELYKASYTTCPPENPAWQVKGSSIVINKNTGRGYATNARLLVKNVPIFYFPYIDFSVDRQRKTGFLWPTVGSNDKWGPYMLTPFYWNIAPNYDTTITPGILLKRGFQFNDHFRYLTTTNEGELHFTVLPNDKAFKEFQESAAENQAYTNPSNTNQPASVTSAELTRLLASSTTRRAFSWRDNARYNDNWSSHLDFNYAGDDYYLNNFANNLNEITQNQLLQEADLYYNDPHWNFTGRFQAYQTLHPINESPVQNQYRRFPQLLLNGDYPDQPYGFEYFISNELTHFEFRNTPGAPTNLPVGDRMNIQPGISLPLSSSAFYVTPRFQTAFTQYSLSQTKDTNTPHNIPRTVPIFDVASGMLLSREINLFSYSYNQTLEPQVYYTYIPYVRQWQIPVFDTTVNTLTYDQLFNYNRFTSIDRIGDANQMSMGVTSRFIDNRSGFEKVRLGVGEIVFFAKRRVTLCQGDTCEDNPENPSNRDTLSPLSGFLDYHINTSWSFNATALWNPTQKLSNSTILFRYFPDASRILNLGYTYARNGDIYSGVQTTDSTNNLKVTDVSLAWPFIRDISIVGRWSQNWNHQHLQNLLYGLQYDTCCWAVRFVGGRAFDGLDPNQNNSPKYTNEYYLQFSLKGLGDIGRGDPTKLLSSITGYQPQFGQELT